MLHLSTKHATLHGMKRMIVTSQRLMPASPFGNAGKVSIQGEDAAFGRRHERILIVAIF